MSETLAKLNCARNALIVTSIGLGVGLGVGIELVPARDGDPYPALTRSQVRRLTRVLQGWLDELDDEDELERERRRGGA